MIYVIMWREPEDGTIHAITGDDQHTIEFPSAAAAVAFAEKYQSVRETRHQVVALDL